MENLIVSGLVREVLKKVISLGSTELVRAWRLEKELKNLESNLGTIHAVLVDAETKQWMGAAVKDWLTKLKDSAYDVEDIVDEIAVEVLKQKRNSQRGLLHRVSGYFSSPNRLIFRLKMSHKMKSAVKGLERLKGERSFHMAEGLMENGGVEGRETSSGVIESEIVGRDHEKEMIVDRLLEDVTDGDVVCVCVICGMGGLGKSTLAQLVYNDKRVEGHFDLRIWVCVTKDFDVKRLTRAMLESIEGCGCDIVGLDPLQSRLLKKLHGRRFLLVLDDVWNENHEKWERMKYVLRVGAKGSNVVVTTRSQIVAQIMATIPVHHMVGLSQDDSWLLFKRRAFGNGSRDENYELDQIGKAIVKRCGGLPLAILALGSLMQFKSSESDWLYVRDSQIWDLPDDGSTILPALRLTYDNSPSHLRKCFAYCCIFPKGTLMEKDTLIELWIANGFISSGVDRSSDDVGHQIYSELVWRSFIQEVDKSFLGEATCVLHDLMHDLALSVMWQELYIVDSHRELKIPKKVRHLLLKGVPLNEEMLESISLRSLVFDLGAYISLEDVAPWIAKQKHLLVLGFLSGANISIKKVPRSIFSSKWLKYLNLSYSRIEFLSQSVCDLPFLETLKLRNCQLLRSLPKHMKKLKNLMYLDITGCVSLILTPPKLGQLTSLRRLSTFIVGNEEGYHIGELKDLHLRGELRIMELGWLRSKVDAERANLKGKPDLVSLDLDWGGFSKGNLLDDPEEVFEGLQPHSNLKKLSINCYPGEKLPNWMLGSVLKNLVELFLFLPHCTQMPPLGKLHFLKKLTVGGMQVKYFDTECYGDGEISFRALETLKMRHMMDLVDWTTVDRPNFFPCLQKLEITNCWKLTKLLLVPTLKSLKINSDSLITCNLTSPAHLGLSHFLLAIILDGNRRFLKIIQLSRMCNIKTRENKMDSLSRYLFNELEFLSISDCPKLETLSRDVGVLRINDPFPTIYQCDSLTALSLLGLECSTSLRFLWIENCTELRLFSERMQHLTALEYLRIKGCPEIQDLLDGMQHLDFLHRLHISDCEGLLSLPNWLGRLQSLSILLIERCPDLRSLPDGLLGKNNLLLRIEGCPHLESSCKKESGEDWPKIAHIPVIEINNERVQPLQDEGSSCN